MREECLIAEFADVPTAQLGLEVLAKAGYGTDQVSFITRQEDPQMQQVDDLEKSESDSRGVSVGVGIGVLLGGAASVPLVASTLIGPFMLIGPAVGAGIGAALGGMLGGATEKEDAGSHFRNALREGGVLLIVTGDKGDLLDVEASVKTAGPTRVTRFSATNPLARRIASGNNNQKT